MQDVQPLADDWGALTPAAIPALSHALRELARLPGIQAIHKHLFDGLNLTTGSKVLELGAGPWLWERALRARVGATGLLVGLDLYPDFLAPVNAPNLLAADARSLPFSGRSFDAIFCSRLLTHVGPTETIIHEMQRATRRGGMIGAFEWSFSNWEIEDDNGRVSDAVHQSLLDAHHRPDVAVELPDIFRDLGLSGVVALPYRERITAAWELPLTMAVIRRHVDLVVAHGRIAPAAAEDWYESIVQRADRGRFALTRTGLAVWGKV